MAERRVVVRMDEGGRWVFGRETGTPFEVFDSREAAVLTATKFVMSHPEVELVVDDTPPTKRPAAKK